MEFKDIVAAASKLNESGKLATTIKTVAVKADIVRDTFIMACTTISMDDLLAVGDDVVNAFVQIVGTSEKYDDLDPAIHALYDALPERFFAAPETPAAAAQETPVPAPETPQVEPTPAPAAPETPVADAAPAVAPETPENIAPVAPETPAPVGDGSLGTEPAPAAAATQETPAAPTAPAPEKPKRGRRAVDPNAKPGEKGYKSDCRDYGKKPDDKSTLCQSCKANKADEYAACHKIVAEKAEKAAKPKGEKKPPVHQKNTLGHRIGGMNDYIDQSLLAGPAFLDDMVKGLMEKFGRDAAHAQAKTRAHIAYLGNEGHKVLMETIGDGDAKRVRYTLTVVTDPKPAVPGAPNTPQA